MSGGLRHHEDEVKGTEPFGWTPSTERRQSLSRKDQCVCAEVGSVFEIMKPRSSNYLTLADVLRDVEKLRDRNVFLAASIAAAEFFLSRADPGGTR